MRKLLTLVGILVLGLLSTSTNAKAQYYAFGFSGFDASNNLTINASAYDNIDSGWINSSGVHGAGNTNYYSGEFDAGGMYPTANYFSFDLSSLTGAVASASFNVYTSGISVNGPYDIYGTSLTPGQVYSGNSFTSVALYDALIDGPEIGTISLTPGDGYTTETITLNATGDAWLQANEGGSVVVGGVFLGGPVPPPTPEPSSLILLGTGIAGMAGMLRRKLAR